MSLIKCFLGCLASQGQEKGNIHIKDTLSFPDVTKAGSTMDITSHDRLHAYLAKPNLTKTFKLLLKPVQQEGDNGKVFPPDEGPLNQSIDIFSEDSIKESNVHSMEETAKADKTRDQTHQLDNLTVDYKPKITIITRSLPQFEPEKKSRFAIESFKKSQSSSPDHAMKSPVKNKKKTRKETGSSKERSRKSSRNAKGWKIE